MRDGGGEMVPWWGELAIPGEDAVQLRIGPMLMWMRRVEGDLLLATTQLNESMHPNFEPLAESADDVPPEGSTLHRFAGVRGRVRLTPRLADRPIIARPEMPFWIPSGADVTVYVSAPLWAVVSTGEIELMELPLFRPSDTWFGPSTIQGELCYAVQTSLRRQLSMMPVRPHRAITAIQIQNHGPDSLRVQRIRLPVHLLGLYSSPDTLLTRGVILERTGPNDDATVKLEALLVSGQLSPPRQPEESRFLHTITSFLP
jgi:hypothetical protein